MSFADNGESFFDDVDASSESLSTGITIPNGETWGVLKFASGAIGDRDVSVLLVFDNAGTPKIFFSARTDIVLDFDPRLSINQMVGNGSKKIQIKITNDSAQTTGTVGGQYEVVKLG